MVQTLAGYPQFVDTLINNRNDLGSEQDCKCLCCYRNKERMVNFVLCSVFLDLVVCGEFRCKLFAPGSQKHQRGAESSCMAQNLEGLVFATSPGIAPVMTSTVRRA